MATQFPENDVFFIPLRLDDCELPRRIAVGSMHYIDLFPDWNRGMKKLVGALEKKYQALRHRKAHNEPAFSSKCVPARLRQSESRWIVAGVTGIAELAACHARHRCNEFSDRNASESASTKADFFDRIIGRNQFALVGVSTP